MYPYTIKAHPSQFVCMFRDNTWKHRNVIPACMTPHCHSMWTTGSFHFIHQFYWGCIQQMSFDSSSKTRTDPLHLLKLGTQTRRTKGSKNQTIVLTASSCWSSCSKVHFTDNKAELSLWTSLAECFCSANLLQFVRRIILLKLMEKCPGLTSWCRTAMFWSQQHSRKQKPTSTQKPSQ